MRKFLASELDPWPSPPHRLPTQSWRGSPRLTRLPASVLLSPPRGNFFPGVRVAPQNQVRSCLSCRTSTFPAPPNLCPGFSPPCWSDLTLHTHPALPHLQRQLLSAPLPTRPISHLTQQLLPFSIAFLPRRHGIFYLCFARCPSPLPGT